MYSLVIEYKQIKFKIKEKKTNYSMNAFKIEELKEEKKTANDNFF